jgi:hypothetical protein
MMMAQQQMMSANGGMPMPPEQSAPGMTAPDGQALPVQPPQGV